MATAAVASKPFEREADIEIGDSDEASLCTTNSSNNSDTTSLTSSVFNFVYENGRRYTSQRSRRTDSAEYMLPNDETEQERLDLGHHMYGVLFKGKLYFAPLENPKRALDLGCGTGIWAIDFADMHPDCEVIGMDLSPIQPSWTPPNVRFEVDDYEDEWLYGKNKFDYIHLRSLTGAVKNWPKLLKNCYDHLAPGGWIEVLEGAIAGAYSEDGSMKGTVFETFTESLRQAGEITGISLSDCDKYGDMMLDAGFVNLTSRKDRSPLGPWAKDPHMKEVGQIVMHIGMTGFEAYGMAMFTRVLKWETEKAKKLVDDCVALLKGNGGKKIHTIYPQYTYYAQKPLDSK